MATIVSEDGILVSILIGLVASIFLFVDAAAFFHVRSLVRKCFYAAQMLPLFFVVVIAVATVTGSGGGNPVLIHWAMIPILAAGLAERLAYIRRSD